MSVHRGLCSVVAVALALFVADRGAIAQDKPGAAGRQPPTAKTGGSNPKKKPDAGGEPKPDGKAGDPDEPQTAKLIDVPIDPSDLVAGKLRPKSPLALGGKPAGFTGCVLTTLPDSSLQPESGNSACDEYFKNAAPMPGNALVVGAGGAALIRLRPNFGDAAWNWSKPFHEVPNVERGQFIYFDHISKTWKQVDADGQKLPKNIFKGNSKEAFAFVNWNEKSEVTDSYSRVKVEPPTTKDQAGTPDPDPRWCTPRDGEGMGGKYLVCVDLVADSAVRSRQQKRARQIRVYPDTHHVLVPNQSVRVMVRYERTSTIRIELGGEEGLFTPSDRNNIPSSEPVKQAEEDKTARADYAIAEQDFAPRTPGQANLTITLRRDGQTTDEVHTVEFIVEQTYLGAVRLGLGAVGGHAVDRAYEARSVGGSSQKEIAAKTRQDVDLELVLGYSAYLSPRGYVTGCYPWCFGPYVGVGILNQGATALETLKSLHAGLEWEPTPNFAIALTGVARRVTRLADGYQVGSPVGDDVPTVTRYELGYGVVFSLSPEFFRVAKGAGTGFFK